MQTQTCSNQCSVFTSQWRFIWPLFCSYCNLWHTHTHRKSGSLATLWKLCTESVRRAILKQAPWLAGPRGSAWCQGTGWLPVWQGAPEVKETDLCWRRWPDCIWWGTTPTRAVCRLFHCVISDNKLVYQDLWSVHL